MQNLMKRASVGAVIGGGLLAAGGFGLAHAAPPAESVVNDGKVSVTVTAGGQEIGVLKDVSLTSAQALASPACPTAGITAEALQALDVDGTAVPGTCAGIGGGPTFAFAQNNPGESDNAPAQSDDSTTPSNAPTAPTTTSSR